MRLCANTDILHFANVNLGNLGNNREQKRRICMKLTAVLNYDLSGFLMEFLDLIS